MLSRYKLPQLFSVLKGDAVWLTVLLFIPVVAAKTQGLPKKPTIQQLAGYQNKQQLNWQQKQLPTSSVTYRFSNKTTQTVQFGKLQTNKPATTGYILPLQLKPTQQTTPTPFLKSYLLQERQQYIKWQKQSWWRDPAKAPATDLMRDFYISNKKN